jgi:hypothetical protein
MSGILVQIRTDLVIAITSGAHSFNSRKGVEVELNIRIGIGFDSAILIVEKPHGKHSIGAGWSLEVLNSSVIMGSLTIKVVGLVNAIFVSIGQAAALVGTSFTVNCNRLFLLIILSLHVLKTATALIVACLAVFLDECNVCLKIILKLRHVAGRIVARAAAAIRAQLESGIEVVLSMVLSIVEVRVSFALIIIAVVLDFDLEAGAVLGERSTQVVDVFVPLVGFFVKLSRDIGGHSDSRKSKRPNKSEHLNGQKGNDISRAKKGSWPTRVLGG